MTAGPRVRIEGPGQSRRLDTGTPRGGSDRANRSGPRCRPIADKRTSRRSGRAEPVALLSAETVGLLAARYSSVSDDPAMQGSLKRSATTDQGHWASVSVSAVSVRARRGRAASRSSQNPQLRRIGAVQPLPLRGAIAPSVACSRYLRRGVIGAGSCPRANCWQARISVSAISVLSGDLTRLPRVWHSAW
jgi:hypothetical protein